VADWRYTLNTGGATAYCDYRLSFITLTHSAHPCMAVGAVTGPNNR